MSLNESQQPIPDNNQQITKKTNNETTSTQTTIIPDEKWYRDAYQYWENEENCPITDDGVLGGYGSLTPVDVRDSNKLFDELKQLRPTLQYNIAADCGAGIGRVTKHLLLPRFNHVDLIEQSPRLSSATPKYLGKESSRSSCIVLGMQVLTITNDNSYKLMISNLYIIFDHL